MLYILPLVLFFSFWPVIRLGGNESMNFELSLPLVWLVMFDGVGLLVLARERKLFDWARGRRWLWLLFPVWLSLTVIWSLNVTRGVLTAGIMWLLYFAGYVMWTVRKTLDERFRVVWWKWFFGSALVMCGWCVVQCVLDLAGVGQDYSLMCDGCTYHMFGFPHPNGFAIEPQFMGNLLLAPAMAAAWLFSRGDCNSAFRGRGSSRPSLRGSDPSSLGRNLRKPLKTLLPVASQESYDNGSCSLCSNFILACFFIITATLFLTFSRGAIYAFVVGMLFMSGFVVFGVKKRERGALWKRVGMVWGLVILSFVVVLNAQGLMAEVGPTSDTYFDGVAKVVNHLSLGVIDLRGDDATEPGGEMGNTEGKLMEDEFVVVENSVENFEEKVVENSELESEVEEPVFSGYVAESTDTRVRLSGAAVQVWSQSVPNALFGVGLGGAGFALYNNGLSPAPKEIVQNEYASLLLETGLVGVSLFVLTLILVIGVIWKNSARVMLIGLLVSYGISLMFFSGLPNALHIVLFPVVIEVLARDQN
ncbi:O-antigen ligase family protein [Candidatus Saccharibacteria bacterium]|nr:O-antigen ligase family protein [Candidatus Saccharibacteria bacterium]